MSKLLRITTLATLLCAAVPAAQAATYSFSGMMDSGSLIGESFTGNFSFDDLGLTGVDLEIRSLNSLSLNILGNTYTLGNADSMPDVSFLNGSFLGLSYSVTTNTLGFSVIPGFSDTSDAFVAYDKLSGGNIVDGQSGYGSIVYLPVPEPETYAMLLAGLGLMGVVARRRSQAA